MQTVSLDHTLNPTQLTMSSIPPKDWSVALFKRYRPHLVGFCDTNVEPHLWSSICSRILIRAPVKSGKREIVEYLAMLDYNSSQRIRHVFISAWHRSADEEQRDELANHNLKVFSINNTNNRDRCLQFLQEQNDDGYSIRLHIDECDHGSGSRQLMSPIWRYVRDRDDVKSILYSATPAEAALSADFPPGSENDDYSEMIDEFEDDNVSVIVNYVPPSQFCGPARFIQEGLVTNATPAFDKVNDRMELTPQFKQIIRDLQAQLLVPGNTRNIVMLRLSYSSGGKRKEHKSIYRFLEHLHLFPELIPFSVLVDKDDYTGVVSRATKEKIQWSNRNWWEDKRADRPILVIYDQTCSRSTEWACHDRVFATHDFRNEITFSVVSQAQERPNHYAGAGLKYSAFQPIKIYGHLPTFQLSAGLIEYEDYMKVSHKIRSTGNVFQIVDKSTGDVVPDIRFATKREAEYKLMEMGSFAEPKLSSRIKGNMKTMVVCESGFIACDLETFDRVAKPQILASLDREGRRIQNPFHESRENSVGSDRLRGYLREWRVFDYDNDIKDSSWGFTERQINMEVRLTVCYRGDELGVGWRIPRSRRLRNRMTSDKSMFPSAV